MGQDIWARVQLLARVAWLCSADPSSCFSIRGLSVWFDASGRIWASVSVIQWSSAKLWQRWRPISSPFLVLICRVSNTVLSPCCWPDRPTSSSPWTTSAGGCQIAALWPTSPTVTWWTCRGRPLQVRPRPRLRPQPQRGGSPPAPRVRAQARARAPLPAPAASSAPSPAW